MTKGESKLFIASLIIKVFDWLFSGRESGRSIRIFLFEVFRNFWERISSTEVYTIISHSTFLEQCEFSSRFVLENDRTGFAANAVIYGKNEPQSLLEVFLPPLVLYCHSDVFVRHGSDHVILRNERIILNDFAAANDNSNNCYVDKGTLAYLRQVTIVRALNDPCQVLDSGIRIPGKFSHNYYHEIYEQLIRLIPLIDYSDRIPSDVPLIVDEEVFKISSLHRIFDLLSKQSGRGTIILHEGEWVKVNKLYFLSDVNVLVPEHKNYLKGRLDDYIFDRKYTLKLREELLKNKATVEYPRRIFISRKNTNHRHFNEDELFSVLEPLGFHKFAPETLTIEQQMTLFNNAEWIIGGSGAAFTNLLFVSQNCKIVCLFRNTDYISPVFSAPVCFNNSQMVYFMSPKGLKNKKAHTDFTVDVSEFRKFIEDYIK